MLVSSIFLKTQSLSGCYDITVGNTLMEKDSVPFKIYWTNMILVPFTVCSAMFFVIGVGVLHDIPKNGCKGYSSQPSFFSLVSEYPLMVKKSLFFYCVQASFQEKAGLFLEKKNVTTVWFAAKGNNGSHLFTLITGWVTFW